MNTHHRPTEKDARSAAARFLGHEDFTVQRYPTGLCHYVFEVTPQVGPKVVVRMGHEDTRAHLAGSVFWDEQLKPLNLPTAKMLCQNLERTFPYTVIEHVSGTDLGNVFSLLSQHVRRKIAFDVARIQDRVGDLPRAQGFGYGFNYTDKRLRPAWKPILEEQLNRAREWIRAAGVAQESHVDRVARVLQSIEGYLQDVEPVPFLHDTTTKNVLVNENGLTGIVDIDDLCFGDRLYVLSLTNMSTLSGRLAADYVESWIEAWNLSPIQRQVLRVYTAIHCVGFIGEIGQKFNKDVVEPDMGRLRHLEEILDGLLG